jgi:teichuronic acid biosynthesis glycosyltransferase TuaG
VTAKAPEVSVVVPAYNAQRWLPATVDAILAQDGVSFELLVVDDGSRDGTAALVRDRQASDARVRYLRTPANCGGPAAPRNLGIEAARADWIALCDADDLWHPRKLALQLACAHEHEAQLVCSAIEDFADGTRPAGVLDCALPAVVPARRLGLAALMLKNRIATSSVLCRREAVRAAGGFDTSRDLIAVEDYDLWLRLLAQPDFRAVRIDTPLVAYRLLPGSISARKAAQARKVLRVLRRAAVRQGWGWLFPLAAPLLMLAYLGSSLALRTMGGRL